MIEKEIDNITEEDLQELIDNSVIEHKTLEYKQELPGNSDRDKKEFLADISSFANSSGGDLLYGIIENRDTGMPKELKGLETQNIDQEINRLDNIIRNGIQPRIIGINIKPIQLSNTSTCLIIRIPKSWISPHRVTFKSHDKFYSRSTNGKYPMDVSELRIAYNLSETIIEKIRKFKEDRISNIIANEIPITFNDGPKIVLHLIPIISFNPSQNYDINKIASNPGSLPPINCRGWNSRFNLDGFLNYSENAERISDSYVQLYRNGIIEAVEGFLLRPKSNGSLSIPSSAYEESLIKSLQDYIFIFKTLNVELPIFTFLNLVGVKGYKMFTEKRRFRGEQPMIDRDILMVPEIMINDYNEKAENILKPCFDSIWNACGFEGSLNYNENGQWIG